MTATARIARIARIASIVPLLFLLAACGSKRGFLAEDEAPAAALDQVTRTTQSEQAAAAASEAKALWQNRGERAAVERAIGLWEEAARLEPASAQHALDLAYANYWLAHGHLRFVEDEEGMLAAYDKGVVSAERAIGILTPAFAQKIKDGADWDVAVKEVPLAGQPAIYWYATNLGRWALLDGFATILRYKDRARDVMAHCKELDERFLYGAPHRYFGVYWTKLPIGKDLDASRMHFERAIEIAPNYLETKVLFAENYAVKADDRQLFDRLLAEVLAAPDDVLPGLEPENRVAKRTAEKLQRDADDYF